MAVGIFCEIYFGSYKPFPAESLLYLPKAVTRRLQTRLDTIYGEGFMADRLVYVLLQHDASEPRDYIFGLRSVYHEILGSIAVDYSVGVAELYSRAAQQILRSGGFKLLFAARHRDRIADCPSWVPDWSSSHKTAWVRYELSDFGDGQLWDFPVPKILRSKRELKETRSLLIADHQLPEETIDLNSAGPLGLRSDRSIISASMAAKSRWSYDLGAMSFSKDSRILQMHSVRCAMVVLSSPEYLSVDEPCRACDGRCKVCKGRTKRCRVCGKTISRSHIWDALDHWVQACKATVRMRDGSDYYQAAGDLLCTSAEVGALKPNQAGLFLELVKDESGEYAESDGRKQQQTIMISEFLAQRHLILTDNGAMGIALLSHRVEKGEVVVKFDVLDHYFAFRPLAQQEGAATQYEFLGWVHFEEDPGLHKGPTRDIFNIV